MLRNLAQKWHNTYLPPPPPHSKRRLLPPGGLTELDTIEHLILLDLLGAPKPHIRSFFPDTAWLFDALVSAESRLFQSGAFSYPEGTSLTTIESFFIPRTGKEINVGYIGDDHLPFMRRGVSVLHLIPEPFPRVWHTLGDDAKALDVPTMRRWNLILRLFFSEYLHLQPEVTASKKQRDQVVSKTQGELVSHPFSFVLHLMTVDTLSVGRGGLIQACIYLFICWNIRLLIFTKYWKRESAFEVSTTRRV